MYPVFTLIIRAAAIKSDRMAPRIAAKTQGNITFSWNHFVPAMPPAYQKARSCPIL
ncbi:hypothetical protein D3C79_1030630 [compost metagenome]